MRSLGGVEGAGSNANQIRTVPPSIPPNRTPNSPGAQRPIKNFAPNHAPVGPNPVGPAAVVPHPKSEFAPANIAIANIQQQQQTRAVPQVRNQGGEGIQMQVANKNIIQRKRTAEGKTVQPGQKVFFSAPGGVRSNVVYTPTNTTNEGQPTSIKRISTPNTAHRITHVKTAGNSPRPGQQPGNRGTQIHIGNYQINNGQKVQTIPVNQLSPQGTIQVNYRSSI